jgi:eukaryotic-like serine/threonine-protein kinase
VSRRSPTAKGSSDQAPTALLPGPAGWPVPGAGRDVAAEGLIADRYEIGALLGSGGTADVFCAYDTRLDRTVALKILLEQWSHDPDRVERFRREARASAQLNHPNIVTVIDGGAWQGRPYIVFEYIEGEDLKELVDREGPLPVERSVELVIQIGRGLAYAHRHGIVHRDVKPQNVLLGGREAKVTDFGLARAADADDLTLTGSIIGTSYYLAPEQASGQPTDERSDVYSLGAVLFELLTGTVPFDGDGFMDVALKHVHEPLPSVLALQPSLPPEIAAVVTRALTKDPAGRFQSMDELVEELEATQPRTAGEQTDTIVPPVPLRVRGQRPRPRRRELLVGVFALVLLCVVGAFFLLRAPARSSAKLTAPSAPPAAGTSTLHAVGVYDPPPGDGVENNQYLPLATDGKLATAWTTQWYLSDHFGGLKSGVGMVLSTGKPVVLKQLTVWSHAPGYQMVVKAGPTQSGPFEAVSAQQTGGQKTTFALHGTVPRAYYLLWITRLSPVTGPRFEAWINEVAAS